MIGRRRIWSDPEAIKASRLFVCVLEECFFLNPPAWMTDPPNPKSTAIFQTFIGSAPPLWPSPTSSHQGMYIMTPDGQYLGGMFASPTNPNAREIITKGWQAWKKQVAVKSPPVPTNPLPLIGGDKHADPVDLKLRVTYRDLPRGYIRRPGDARFPNPYNLGWYDLKFQDACKLITDQSIETIKQISLKVLKDSVRGQMHGWNSDDWKGGTVKVRKEKADGYLVYYRIEGHADLQRSETLLKYQPTLYGKAVYDLGKGVFMDFQLLAVGQRQGAGPSNAREADVGPAPMGVALRLIHR